MQNTQLPTVLILAYSWPPDASAGTVRPVYLARQLANHGLRPVVITVREDYHPFRNELGVAGSDSARVIRTGYFKNPRFLYLWLKKRLWGTPHGGSQRAASAESGDTGKVRTEEAEAKPRLKKNLVTLLSTPDEHFGWFPFALAAAWKEVSRKRPVCVISTCPPHTAHLVAMAIKWLRGVPWIADVRDPWSWYDLPSAYPICWKESINARLERFAFGRADRIVCVAPKVTDRYRELYPNLPAVRWETITNGFDLDEIRALGPVDRAKRFTIVYIGSFDYGRSPLLLLRAIAALIASGAIDPARIDVRFVGECEFAQGRSVSAMIEELGLAGVAKAVPNKPRPEALRELLAAHVLFQMAGTQILGYAAKLFEYLAVDRPILAVAKDWAGSDVIRQLDAGIVVAPDDLDGMTEAVLKFYNAYVDGSLAGMASEARLSQATAEYGWERLGKRYADLIAEIASANRLSG